MSKKTRIIILSVLAVLIVVVLSVSITTAFMKPIDQGGNITEVSLSSCAKIKLEGTTSIKLTNSYPMSRNKGLQTTPYTFTVTSYCDTYVGFNLYLATLNTNSLSASNIHYIITEKGSKEALVEGTLTSSLDDASNFTDVEKTELNAGLSGTYGNIFKLYNNKVPYKGSATYDLYLFVDENATEYQNTTFAAGVAVKSYEREADPTLADYVKSLYTGTQGENGIYYHDASLTNGAEDNSYRFAGASSAVNNYVCFGSTESPCPEDNLYRIIGVFDNKVGENQTEQRVKLIKSDYATTALLGADGDYNQAYTATGSFSEEYKGNNLANIAAYYWNKAEQNTWSLSNLNKTNLNTNFITSIGADWAAKIAEITWKVGGNTFDNIGKQPAKTAYQNEVVKPVPGSTSSNGETEHLAKIGLMYASDYGFAAAPSAWTANLNTYNGEAIKNVNWMYMGLHEWTISRYVDDWDGAFLVFSAGDVTGQHAGSLALAVRPVFYLTSSVNYVSGSGTAADPIVVN
ncbi:hypothetical protein EGP99_03510 [bacterium]|nr:hypothetical protein [bacterium]